MWAQLKFFRDGSTGTGTTPILHMTLRPEQICHWSAGPDGGIVEGDTETVAIQMHFATITRDRHTGVMRNNGVAMNIEDAEKDIQDEGLKQFVKRLFLKD